MGENFFSLYLYYNKKPLRLAGESRRFNNCPRLFLAERNACGFRCRFLSFLGVSLGITLNPLAIKCSVHIHIIPYYLLVVYRRFIRPLSVEPN